MDTLSKLDRALDQSHEKNNWTEIAAGYRLCRLINAAEATDPSRDAGAISGNATRRGQLYRVQKAGWHQFRFGHTATSGAQMELVALSVPHAGPDEDAAGNLVEWAAEPLIHVTLTCDTAAIKFASAPAVLAAMCEAITAAVPTHIKDRRVFIDPSGLSAGAGYDLTINIDSAGDRSILWYVPNGGTFTAGILAVLGKQIQ